jgi:hypothetical protein
MKRAGRTEHEIKNNREKGNIYTAELKLRSMLNRLGRNTGEPRTPNRFQLLS